MSFDTDMQRIWIPCYCGGGIGGLRRGIVRGAGHVLARAEERGWGEMDIGLERKEI